MPHGILQNGGGPRDAEMIAALHTQRDELVTIRHRELALRMFLGVIQLLDTAAKADRQLARVQRFAATVTFVIGNLFLRHARIIAAKVGQNPSDRDYTDGVCL